MTEFRRKSFAIPDRVFDILNDYPEEIEIEVLRTVRAYCRYWDAHRTDEGFNFDPMSILAQRVFFRIYDELLENNQKYYAKCAAMRENARASVKIVQSKKRLNKRNRRYYEKHKKRILENRRKRYQARDCGDKTAQKTSEQFSEKRLNNSEKCLNKTTEQFDAALETLSAAENSAIAPRITGLNNPTSLRSVVLLDGGIGGKPSYPQGGCGQVGSPEDPASGLPGSKAGQTGRLVPVCSKAVGSIPADEMPKQVRHDSSGVRHDSFIGRSGSRAVGDAADAAAVGQCGSQAVQQSGNQAAGQPGSGAGRSCSSAPPDGAPQSGGSTPPRSARNVCAAGSAANPWPQIWKSAPHPPGPDEVKITKKFKIDFTDPVFKPYHLADSMVLYGLEHWLRRELIGRSVEKTWLASKIVDFHIRHGKLNILMGVEGDE